MLSEITNLQSTRTVTLTQVAYLLQVSLDRILNVDSNTSMDVVTNVRLKKIISGFPEMTFFV